MTFQERLAQELLEATKQRDNIRVSTLRLLISAIRNKEIERHKSFADGEVLEVIGAEAKTRRESIAEFQKAGRSDLVAKEQAELKVLEAYLPPALSEEELLALAQKAIQSVGAQGPKDMGKVMSALMPQIKGRSDGRQAQQVVQKLLK